MFLELRVLQQHNDKYVRVLLAFAHYGLWIGIWSRAEVQVLWTSEKSRLLTQPWAVPRPAIGHLQCWHPVHLAHEAARRPWRSRVGFIHPGKASPIEVWFQICSSLKLVTCVEWLVLNGSRCDSPGEAPFLQQMVWISPGVRRKPVTYCHKAINHWQITRATVKDVKPAAAFCTLSNFTISHHWVLAFEMEVRHSIGLLSAVRVGVKQLRQLTNGPVPLSRLMAEAKMIAGILFHSNSKQLLEAQRGSIGARRATSRCSH